jgi:hypothetical protein
VVVAALRLRPSVAPGKPGGCTGTEEMFIKPWHDRINFMNLEKYTSRLLLVPVLWLALSGCASLQSSNYPTLKQTEIIVSGPMYNYRNAAGFGRLTLGEKERINSAYTAYETAYNQALQAAHGNRDAPTPENVKQRANELVSVISATPMISSMP